MAATFAKSTSPSEPLLTYCVVWCCAALLCDVLCYVGLYCDALRRVTLRCVCVAMRYDAMPRHVVSRHAM
eukprot:224782-Lingulodinium_polyedra.AAC.1